MRVMVLSAIALAIAASSVSGRASTPAPGVGGTPSVAVASDTMPPNALGALIMGEHARATFIVHGPTVDRTARVTGGFLGLEPEILQLEVALQEGHAREIPISDLLRLEVGREHRQTGRGAWIGALTGVGVGIALAAIGDSGEAAGAVVGGGIGAGGGALIGHRMRTMEWREVALPR